MTTIISVLRCCGFTIFAIAHAAGYAATMQMSVTSPAVRSDFPISRQNVAEPNIRVMLRSVQPGHGCPAKMLRFIKLNTSSIKSGRIVRHSRRMTLGVVHSAPGRNSVLFFFIFNYRPSFKKECRRKGFRRHSVVGCVMCRAL